MCECSKVGLWFYAAGFFLDAFGKGFVQRDPRLGWSSGLIPDSSRCLTKWSGIVFWG